MPEVNETVISVDDVSKFYQIGKQNNKDLRSVIGSIFKKKESSEPFLALNDISFNIKKGEILGIIGKNGAGKSTLLKILSKITSPSKGRIEITGRVASLLEVGTGFHPELTGRENIYLNGTILGMTRKEVQSKFNDIVDFSGISKFIDTPVKRYSSGMYVRLAFSVAAHLEPEILIIDEVLAVGDFEFQKKCLGKMEEVANGGRTVVFVSHNLNAIRNLCTRAIMIHKGKLIAQGEVENVIKEYQNQNNLINKEFDLSSNETLIRHTQAVKEIIFDHISFINQPFQFGDPIDLTIGLKILSEGLYNNLELALRITDKNENCMIHLSNKYIDRMIEHKDDQTKYNFKIINSLRPGQYKLVLFMKDNNRIQDWITDGVYFEITDGNPYNYNMTNEIQGSILPMFEFNVKNSF